ncbi:MAG: hypothetical protein H6912_04180 [Kordiimonadaceae bacterium]|nr:hypothetical protein [Kordiimonadaceae bacterium]
MFRYCRTVALIYLLAFTNTQTFAQTKKFAGYVVSASPEATNAGVTILENGMAPRTQEGSAWQKPRGNNSIGF